MTRAARVLGSVGLALALTGVRLSAQAPDSILTDAFAGSVLESYLRYSETLTDSIARPMSIRAFSSREIARMSRSTQEGDWSSALKTEVRHSGRVDWGFIAPTGGMTFNSAFPYGPNDGAVWKGRGLTTFAQGGVWARWRGVSLQFAPTAFRAENKSFRLMPNGDSTASIFADGRFPATIDKPQAFGSHAYQRIDPGESSIRVDSHGLVAGVSTASEWWGPTSEFPVVLGNNAGGFPHFFAGTSSPASIKIARIHGRLVYGYLDQSAYSPVKGSSEFKSFAESGTRRFAAGVVGLIQFQGLTGIELGGTRFFHAANTGWPSNHNLLLPIQGLLKNSIAPEKDSAFGGNQAVKENQLASVFARFAPPRSGFELYFEFGREDHSADARDLYLEPDHSSLTNIGFRQAWQKDKVLTAVRAEALTYELAGGLRTRVEGEGGAYSHSILRQGHTLRGQLLAADVGPGSGSAQIITLEQFAPQGRWSAYFRRAVAHETTQVYKKGDLIPRAVDVLNTLGGDFAQFRGPLEITLGGTLTFDLNRDLISDRTNLGLGISVRHAW
jgi:hypothetical protein